MSETQTPRTDAEVLWIPNGPDNVRTVDIDFARALERELTAAIARAESAEATVERCKQVCYATAEGWRETQAELDEALAKLALYETLRPIETAPTDGSEILLYNGKRAASGHYGKPDGWANPKRFVWTYIHLDPTHWTPLPDVKEATK